jgi:type II secretory pathway pseudopilin PulG
MATKHIIRQRGFALIGVLLFLLLLSAMAVTLTYSVTTEKRMSGSDQEQNQAYYAAEAGMEKMTADLGSLYTTNRSPSAQQIINLGNDKPNLPGVGYAYSLSVPQNPDGSPQSRVQTISAGDMEGLSAQVIPISLDVVATRFSGAQVHLTRDVEVAQIPVFQFGVFSDTDLSYHAGPNFDFAGRVHTNGDLYLSQSSGATLTFHDKITVGGEIIRQTLVNGVSTTPSYTGTVDVPTAPSGCNGSACRALALIEGSVQGGKGSPPTPGWDSFASNNYNKMLNHQSSQLTLPFVQDGPPIEIIREPLATDTTNLNSSRLFTQAQIRVLLGDTQADLPGNPQPGDIQLNAPGACFPVTGANTTCVANANDSIDSRWKRPTDTPTGDWSLINGWLRVEARQNDGSYKNVTQEWLTLGFARGLQTPDSEHGRSNLMNPNAILIFQQLADLNKRGTPDNNTSNQHYNWLPLNFYDSREGERRENAVGGTTCSVGGIMNAVELDVGNLRKWLSGAIGTTGVNTESASQNGYILYYGDHRGMLADPNPPGSSLGKHGDFGYEDFLNSSSPSGASDNFAEPAEDVNQDNNLQTYGASNLGRGFGVADNDPTNSVNCSTVGRMNRVSGARHALMAVNGTLGNLPINFPNNTGGFTIASEEPVYVMGNYNASDAAQFGDPHASAAVIADTVTLLSKNWSDEVSMFSPRAATGSSSCSGTLANPAGNGSGRQACTTWYRLAIASGKSIPFPHPGWSTTNDFGTDGGVHNFLRYLEKWDGQTSNYQGSMVSLYFSRYGVGVFKCCNMVYTPPNRNYAFDTDFLDPSKMPPGTPRFIDVVNVDVVQDMTPR